MASSVWKRLQNLNVTGKLIWAGNEITATAPELNRVCDASARIITSSVTAFSLTITEHAERIVLINTSSTLTHTTTLPTATGSGAKFTLIVNGAQTQGSLVVAANGTDVISGKAVGIGQTAGSSDIFNTTATSDKITFNLTTTGGLGYDRVEAIDISANTYLVDVVYHGSGTLLTPFSAT